MWLTNGPRCAVVVALAVPLLIGAAATHAHGAGDIDTSMSGGMRVGDQRKDGRNHSSRASAARRIIEKACAVIPDRPAYEIVLVDPELAGDPAAVQRLDAFTVRDVDGRLRPKIYINEQSAILQEAIRGNDFYVNVLAAVIVHEIEHLKGGSETAARYAERRFFEGLVAKGHVAPADGQRYLALLREHSDDER